MWREMPFPQPQWLEGEPFFAPETIVASGFDGILSRDNAPAVADDDANAVSRRESVLISPWAGGETAR